MGWRLRRFDRLGCLIVMGVADLVGLVVKGTAKKRRNSGDSRWLDGEMMVADW